MPAPSTAASSDQPLLRSIDHTVSLPVFEGPLDLLLFLIRRQEIDIYDIPIVQITRQYLDILHRMEKQSLEVAGEFFVMAATLMQIKSRLLLPKDEQIPQTEDDEEEENDPRWELVQQLLQYRKYKDAAETLRQYIENARQTWFRELGKATQPPAERPLKPVDAVGLWNAFNQVLRRLSERIQIGQIHDETVTVAERMEVAMEKLRHRQSFLFSEWIEQGASAATLIASFLALMELTRLGRVSLQQDYLFADILCQRIQPAIPSSPPSPHSSASMT